jgi:hypothetical protein
VEQSGRGAPCRVAESDYYVDAEKPKEEEEPGSLSEPRDAAEDHPE